MRLDNDLIRELILYIEENDSFGNYIEHTELQKSFSDFDLSTLSYYIRYMHDANLIDCSFYLIGFIVKKLTPKGHEFAQNIRNDNVWNKTKQIANEVGATTLSAIVQIASNVISELISKSFGK